MRFTRFIPLILLAVYAAQPSRAEEMPQQHHHAQMPMSPGDLREAVRMPAEMKAAMLGNMRDHLASLTRILAALAAEDYDGAARIAREHLGLDSPSAAGCKPPDAGAPPPEQGSMDAMMALHMPEPMRAAGYAMHDSASAFAATALTHDRKATAEALSRLTQNCLPCHAAYRLE